MAEDKVCCIKRYYGLCPDHGMDANAHASLVKTSINYHALRPLMDDLAQEAANLMAWEKQTSRERGKTAEGRTVTALGYALQALRKKSKPSWRKRKMLNAARAIEMTNLAKQKKAKRQPKLLAFYTKAYIRAGNKRIMQAAKQAENDVTLTMTSSHLGFPDSFIDVFLPSIGWMLARSIEDEVEKHFLSQGFSVKISHYESRMFISWK